MVYDDYNIVFLIPIILDPNVILPVTHSSPSQNSTQLPGRNVMFVLTANVTESSGSRGSVVSFEPPVFNPDTNLTTLYDLQIVGCTLSWSPQRGIVDAQTRYFLSAFPTGVKTSSKWDL
ncbi:hypothetical protein AcV5_006785 [Taiwanofungus camphoratus]|nr:hypothetical protein AcV5_006785 [Antrodia cinnamomea]KAI0935260.1 hypothetical protein AcV7_003749 [Antrodia cinnamomea]